MLPSDIEREKQRIRFSYEEELAAREAKYRVALRLIEQKEAERGIMLDKKVAELRDGELAMLNILEDARDLEGKLQEQRDRLQLVINSMGEGLMLLDNICHILLINTKAEDILGLAHGEVKGKCLHDIITAWKGDVAFSREDFLSEEFAQGSALSAMLADDMYFETKTKKKFPVSFAFTPFIEHTARLAVIVFRDITAEKALDDAKSQFISLASHQLRTPLTAIRWYAELLLGHDAGKLSDVQENFISQIYTGATKLGETINTLLSLARIEGGALQLEPEPIDIPEFIRTIVLELDPLAKEKNLRIEVHTPETPLPVIPMDNSLLREVLMNLISNAIRYSHNGGVIGVSCTNGDDAVTVTVKDNGIGIPESQKGRIFERFFRADNAIGMVMEGTGLGLNLAKSLVELWNGSIGFESEEGKGTTFHFTIPHKGIQEKKKGKPLA